MSSMPAGCGRRGARSKHRCYRRPMPTTIRRVALIDVLSGERRATHTAGFPTDPSQMLPVADVVLLVADEDPGAMLFRYTAFGEAGGDSWHPLVEAALEAAAE